MGMARTSATTKVGFVPTMGYLHKGHLELMKFGRSHCDVLVASIFVNPTQFGPGEDYNTYPRDLARDQELAEWAHVDYLFLPDAASMYPSGFRTFVEVDGMSKVLCGAVRPGHFRGVATVVTKFLNIIQPDEVYLGEKDAQQLLILRKMVADLNLPVKVVGFPTVRENDGLAMSSRNVYLSDDERHDATVLYRALEQARAMIKGGEHESSRIIEAMRAMIAEVASVQIDYIAIVDADTLQDLSRVVGHVLIALAARVGKARLIDNIMLEVHAV